MNNTKSPLNAVPGNNLFGLDEQDYDKSRVVVIPAPYDATLSYGTGAREGPRAIIEASRNIELYSYELSADLSKLGIYTMPAIMPDFSSPEKNVRRIAKEVGLVIDDGKIPLLLGGEHTVMLGALTALKERKRSLSVIQFDAHTDTRDELNSTKYSHATVMSRAKELYKSIFQVGIRSVDEAYAKNSGKVYFIEEIRERGPVKVAKEILKSAEREVYLTFDFDVLDPSEMPSVGTPEPNGLRFSEVAEMIKVIAERRRLVGADFVELSPIPYLHAPDFLAAKLIYLTLGYFLHKG